MWPSPVNSTLHGCFLFVKRENRHEEGTEIGVTLGLLDPKVYVFHGPLFHGGTVE